MPLARRREILLYLLSLITVVLPQKTTTKEILTTWDSIRKIRLQGGLKIFWNIYGRDHAKNQLQAIDRGMTIATTVGSYLDYKGNQKENIYNFLEKGKHDNPWNKPKFFEKTISQNLEYVDPTASIIVHDIEFEFERDPEKLGKIQD